ncbi:MAG: hypothetical protein HY690_08990 [Chloroflexi bacterium]|nr:hypothetical protein [Chloroflexota bacterium]
MGTVAAVPEIAGEHGDLYPLVTTVPQADALVSVGSLPEPISFGPIERVLGGLRFGRATVDPRQAFALPSVQVPGVIDMMGGTRVSVAVT